MINNGGLKIFLLSLLTAIIPGCMGDHTKATEEDFRYLMHAIAEGWSTQNTDMALNCFDEDAIYMEPPNVQYYRGHEQLRSYFDALTSEYRMEFHNLWFSEATQSGAGEYTFSYLKDTSDVGVVVVELEKGKIKFWREYQRKGPTRFEDFLNVEGKEWEWHIGNYPEIVEEPE